jgi:serine/threonine protein kinase
LWPDQKEHGFSFSKEATDFIKQLLNRDKKKRLGAKNDSDEVLAHKFLKGVAVQKIVQRKFKAPYQPKKQDLSNMDIDPQFEKMLLEQDDIPESIKKLID